MAISILENGLQDQVNALNSNLTNLLKVKTHAQASITIGAGGALNLTADDLNVSTPSGYTPIALTGIYCSDNNVFFRSIDARATGDTSFCVVRNVANSSVFAVFNVTILYAKNSFI